MRIAALGRTKILWNTIARLVSAGHEVRLVATCKAAPEYDIGEEDFRALAAKLGARFLLSQSLNSREAVAVLKGAGAEIAVSVNWINIIGPEACASFPLGILNAHAGDLPRYRGNAPVAWAILQGEARVGITIHQMDPHELDAGPVILKEYFPLADDTYIGEVYKHLERRLPDMFASAVAGLGTGEITPRPQESDPALALRCYPRRPEDGLIAWGQPAVSIATLVRASAEPFGGAFTFLQGERLVVWRARPRPWPLPALAVPGQVVWRDQGTGEVGVATADGVLAIQEVELGQGGRCGPARVIKSLRERLTSARYGRL